MNKLDPQFYKEFSSGQINNVNENLLPANSVELAKNLVADEELGSLVSRWGSSLVGAQLVASKSILGLFNFRDNVGTSHKLFATINASDNATSVIYDVIAGSAAVTGLTASLKMRFLQFLDSVLAINGTDAVRAYNGTSWITTGGAFDLGNMPSGNKYVIEFLDRVYLAGDASAPDKIFYSGVASGGAVSWTVGNGFVNVEPEDNGGGIKGFGKVPGYLIILKERTMKRWNFQSAFPESLVDIGTPSNESIISKAGICAFFSATTEDATGFYITNGGRPVPISHLVAKNIKKWIDAIPASYYPNISGFGTETHFFWSIGAVTVDGQDYSNVVVRWSVKTSEWVVYTYPTEFKVFAQYLNASDENVIVGGDNNGQVIEIEDQGVYTDAGISGSKIDWEMQTRDEDFQYNQIKSISEKVVLNTRNVQNGQAFIKTNLKEKEQSLGNIKGNIAEIKFTNPIQFNYARFILRGTQVSARAVIKEVEVPNIEVTQAYTPK